MKAQQLDFKVFEQPVSDLEVHSVVNSPRLYEWLAQRLSIWLILALMMGPLFVFVVFANVTHLNKSAQDALTVIALVCFFFFLGAAITWRKLYDATNSAKTKKFAETNHFTYLPLIADPELNGMLFDNGTNREALDIVEGTFNELRFELGNFRFVTRDSGKSRTRTYGYAWIALPRRLPHMVLDSKSDNFLGLTSMSDDFSGQQKLQLEGDFNKFFDLYCPKDYERDALYIFTPDLMALLIDHGNKFDLEIVDDRLYLYLYGGFNFTTSTHLKLIFKALELVGLRMNRQTRYADAQVGNRAANIIAMPGRRLKRGYMTVLITILIGLIVFIVRFWLQF